MIESLSFLRSYSDRIGPLAILWDWEMNEGYISVGDQMVKS